MKILTTCNSRIEAEVICSLLLANDLHPIIQSDDMAGLNTHLSLTSGVHILVPLHEFKIAKQFLDNEEQNKQEETKKK